MLVGTRDTLCCRTESKAQQALILHKHSTCISAQSSRYSAHGTSICIVTAIPMLPRAWPDGHRRVRVEELRHGLGLSIESCLDDCITPPFWEFKVAETKNKGHEDAANGCPNVEGARDDIGVLACSHPSACIRRALGTGNSPHHPKYRRLMR